MRLTAGEMRFFLTPRDASVIVPFALALRWLYRLFFLYFLLFFCFLAFLIISVSLPKKLPRLAHFSLTRHASMSATYATERSGDGDQIL